ncbi:MAG: dienelactone hydrolase family protein [Candidatus Binataceae bacterium]
MTVLRYVALAVAILFVVTVARLAVLEKGGPAHDDVMLDGGIPATFYLPGAGNPFFELVSSPQAQRPPGVVLVHGFSGDREIMSALARWIAQNGYAVLAIDVRGHGANRNPFDNGFARPSLRPDVKAAVDFMRQSDRVDGSKIVVMGHSMGSGAVLDYAENDPNLQGAVMISGGWSLGPQRAKNALFIFAQHDPEFIQTLSTAIATRWAGVQQIELGKTYGDFAQGTAVEAIQVPGVNHVQIVTSKDAATTIVKWLDSTFGMARTTDIKLSDPRLRLARIARILFLILLIPIGRIAGSIATEWAERPAGADGWIGLAILAAALLVVMPLVANDAPASFVSLVIGDAQVSWFGAAGVVIIATLLLWRRLEWVTFGGSTLPTMLAAALAVPAIYVCQNSYSVTFHRLAMTPERLIAWIFAAAMMLPFWLGFEFLVRRGGMLMSTVLGSLGRVIIIVLLFVAVSVGIFSGVLFLILPIIVLQFIGLEILAASAYSTSRNLFLIALIESAWFAVLLAATNPITFML